MTEVGVGNFATTEEIRLAQEEWLIANGKLTPREENQDDD